VISNSGHSRHSGSDNIQWVFIHKLLRYCWGQQYHHQGLRFEQWWLLKTLNILKTLLTLITTQICVSSQFLLYFF